jgi:DNA-binding NtrC family response regulator
MKKDSDNKGHPKILFVDDSESARTTLRAVLEANQFLVSTGASVAEAIHLIDTQPFEVLLSDLHIPGTGDRFTVVSAIPGQTASTLDLTTPNLATRVTDEADRNSHLIQVP